MIHQRQEGDLLIVIATDDADRPEVERIARDGLARRMRVNLFREHRGEKVLLGTLQRVRAGFRLRGPHAVQMDDTAGAAVWRALGRFKVDDLGILSKA